LLDAVDTGTIVVEEIPLQNVQESSVAINHQATFNNVLFRNRKINETFAADTA
jgi:hypothetical protein